METLEILKLALQLMEAVNERIHSEVFLDIVFDVEEEEIRFDCLGHNLVHAYRIQELLNLGVHMSIVDDKIQYALLP